MNPKPDMKIPALYGGLIIGLVSSIPFVSFVNCFCCAGVLFGGFLSVMFYKNNFTPDTPPFTSGDCALVGLLAGVIGAVVSTACSLLFTLIFGDLAMKFLLDFLRHSNIQLPANVLDQLETAMAEKLTVFHIVTNFFFAGIIYMIFGLLGGLIGYSVYKPKQFQVMPPPPAPPTSF